jgi:hypothetical protein
MSAALRRIPVAWRTWYGLMVPPFAWALQFVFGFGLTQWQCNRVGHGQSVPVDGWTAAATAIAAALSVLAAVAGLSAFFETREAEHPPLERVHFLAAMSLATTPLFLAIVLMAGLGVIHLPDCVQS